MKMLYQEVSRICLCVWCLTVISQKLKKLHVWCCCVLKHVRLSYADNKLLTFLCISFQHLLFQLYDKVSRRFCWLFIAFLVLVCLYWMSGDEGEFLVFSGGHPSRISHAICNGKSTRQLIFVDITSLEACNVSERKFITDNKYLICIHRPINIM